MTIKKQSIQI